MVTIREKKPGFINVSCSDRLHRIDRFVRVGLIRCPFATVEVGEQHEARPRCALVPVWQWMVPSDPTSKDGRLVDEIRIEVRLVESGFGARGGLNRRGRPGWP